MKPHVVARERVQPLFDPEALARAESLGLMARSIVEGYRVGAHRSPFQGFALEFAQHREYAPGDDLRHLDWKVLARTDRYFLKQYEQDTNLVAWVLLDASESMGYGSTTLTKLHYAKACAATLAHAILLQKDAVGLGIFDAGIREQIARTDNQGKIHEILRRLAAIEAAGQTDIGETMEKTALAFRNRGIAIVFSDFFEDEARLERGIQRLRFLRHEVILFHVLDHQEIAFEFRGSCRFQGLEGTPTVQLSPEDYRKDYLHAFGEFQSRIRIIAERNACHYVLADTSHPVAEVLGGYLSLRLRMGRSR